MRFQRDRQKGGGWRWRSGVLFLGMALLFPGLGRADYIADQFVTISHGEFGGNQQIFSSRIYAQKKKFRMEMVMGGRRAINISRGDKDPPLFWSLMPDEKMYMERVGGPEGAPGAFSKESRKDFEKIFLRKEPVAGIMTNKFRLVWKDKSGNRKTGLAWEAIELNNAPIRQEFFNDDEHILVQLTNIKVQRLDPALFEIPDGYKKISMPPQAGKK